MALDFYREGFGAGESSANVSARDIRAVGQAGLVEMVASKIGMRRAFKDAQWHVKHANSWAVGFFDGFLSRAESILQSEAE